LNETSCVLGRDFHNSTIHFDKTTGRHHQKTLTGYRDVERLKVKRGEMILTIKAYSLPTGEFRIVRDDFNIDARCIRLTRLKIEAWFLIQANSMAEGEEWAVRSVRSKKSAASQQAPHHTLQEQATSYSQGRKQSIWEFEENGTWKRFDAARESIVEGIYCKGVRIFECIFPNGNTGQMSRYTYDCARSLQINCDTGYTRNIRRRAILPCTSTGAEMSARNVFKSHGSGGASSTSAVHAARCIDSAFDAGIQLGSARTVTLERGSDGSVGIRFKRPEGATVGPIQVMSVLPNSAAKMSGQLRAGDLIGAIDGQDVSTLDDAAVVALFRGAPSTRYTLRLSR
jgi:hypothetical protein